MSGNHLTPNNGLSGTLPSSFGLLSNLENLRFTQNKLTGTLSTLIGMLPNIEILHRELIQALANIMIVNFAFFYLLQCLFQNLLLV